MKKKKTPQSRRKGLLPLCWVFPDKPERQISSCRRFGFSGWLSSPYFQRLICWCVIYINYKRKICDPNCQNGCFSSLRCPSYLALPCLGPQDVPLRPKHALLTHHSCNRVPPCNAPEAVSNLMFRKSQAKKSQRSMIAFGIAFFHVLGREINSQMKEDKILEQ